MRGTVMSTGAIYIYNERRDTGRRTDRLLSLVGEGEAPMESGWPLQHSQKGLPENPASPEGGESGNDQYRKKMTGGERGRGSNR